MDVVERDGHRLAKAFPESEVGGNRRRQRTARPVRVRAFDALVPEVVNGAVVEDVHEIMSGKVSALDQRGAGASCAGELLRGGFHRRDIAHRAAHENGGFVQVGRHERRQWHELTADQRDCGIFEKLVSRSRDHHGIQNVGLERVPTNPVRDFMNDPGIGEHAGFHCRRSQVAHDRVELGANQVTVYRTPRRDAEGVLCGDRGENRRSKNAETVERLEVALNARTTAGVGPGDGESDRKSQFLPDVTGLGGIDASRRLNVWKFGES